MNGKVLNLLHARIAAVCPIRSVSADGSIAFADNATISQRAAAQAILDAFDPVAAQAEVEAEEQAETARQEVARKLHDWLRTQTRDVREHFQDLQAELDSTKNAFQTFKTQSLAFKKKIEGWAATKGGYTP